MYPVVLPCKPGSDCWYVDAETFEVCYEKGGITGFVVLDGEILALDLSGERMELHTEWCCLTREEAEEFSEKMRKKQFAEDDVDSLAFPCPIGSDYWYVEPEALDVVQVKGGIRGFAYHDGKTFAIVEDLEMLELHDRWCCLSREEALTFRQQLLTAR